MASNRANRLKAALKHKKQKERARKAGRMAKKTAGGRLKRIKNGY